LTYFAGAALGVGLMAIAGTAQGAVLIYRASLNGANEVPPTASTGTGTALVTVDDLANTLEVQVTFTGLESNTTASHIHCCTTVPFAGNAGVATTLPTFTGFPTGVTSGTYDHTFSLLDLGSYNPAFVTANGGTASSAEAALLSGLSHGDAYLNIHDTMFPGGAIRGFLAVPEPGAWVLMLVGLGGIGAALRRSRSRAAFAAA
jgi:hypothetical protein